MAMASDVEIDIDRETSKLLTTSSRVFARVPGVSVLMHQSLFCADRKPFDVGSRDGVTHVALTPYAELMLRDVIDTCCSTQADAAKLERVKQTLCLGGYVCS
jgi:hypothetical protein